MALLTLLVVEYRLKDNSLIIVEAIITCIIAPVAAAAPVVTAKLGGKLEQMTTYTFISNFITALLIPVCFPLIDKAANVSFLTVHGSDFGAGSNHDAAIIYAHFVGFAC